MRGKLIILEAGDGCGKATQARRLYEALRADGENVRRIEFPDYQSPSSALIKMYLRGEFGADAQAVNAYAASAFYAVDRYASYKKDWRSFYEGGGVVVADRYTTSNMVHQAVKIAGAAERRAYLDWLWDLEFVKFGLPVPDGVILLDVPPAYSRRLIAARAARLPGDLHERDDAYLERCYEAYRAMAGRYAWRRVECVRNGDLRSVAEIHGDVYALARAIIDAPA